MPVWRYEKIYSQRDRAMIKSMKIIRLLELGFSCLAISILVACARTPVHTTKAEQALGDIVKEQRAQPALPPEVSEALLTGKGVDSSTSIPPTPRFNVSVNRIPARTFFLSLVSDSGVNVVAHPEISGEISLELKNVSVEEVLNVTREVFGYEYRFKNGIYTIFPRKLRTEIFPINYLDVKRVGVTDTSVLIGKITSGSSGTGGRNSGNSSNSGGSQNSSAGEQANLLSYLGEESSKGGKGQGISPGTRVQTLTTADFWTGLNEALLAIVGGDEGGRMVMVNPQSSLVVIKALPNELSDVRDFLSKSELSVKRQVVLETKILEVHLNDEYASGINWAAISGAIIAGQDDIVSGSLSDIFSGNDVTRESFISSVLEVSDITKLLHFLDEQGDVQVLSSPRISTVNNQKAVIRVGSDEFFVTGISNSTTASATSVVSIPEVELDSFFSGISLDVTPQISDDGDVILHVHPLVSDVQDQLKEIQVAGQNFALPLALRDVRESDSIVKARSGQVVVLGGLMQERIQDVVTKRPLLGDIPVVNGLFKAKQKRSVKTELVILMQPVVVDDDTWTDQIERQSQRVKTLYDEFQAR